MKSVVLEIKENKAAVLDDSGVVHAIKNKGYEVGQVLSLSEFELKQDEIKSKARTGMSTFTRTAAAILAVAIIGGGVTAYAAPVSTVTVDGGTSVEYKLNLLGRVIGVSSSDEEISEEISELSKEVRGMKIDDAIDATTVRFEKDFVVQDEDTEMPEIKVHVSGLKGRDAKFTESLDHKVEKMNEANKDRLSERHTETKEESTDTNITEPTKPADDVKNNSSSTAPADIPDNASDKTEAKPTPDTPDNKEEPSLDTGDNRDDRTVPQPMQQDQQTNDVAETAPSHEEVDMPGDLPNQEMHEPGDAQNFDPRNENGAPDGPSGPPDAPHNDDRP